MLICLNQFMPTYHTILDLKTWEMLAAQEITDIPSIVVAGNLPSESAPTFFLPLLRNYTYTLPLGGKK